MHKHVSNALICLYNNLVLVKKMSTITIRIDPSIKRRMKKYSHINWSEVIRQAIIEKLRELESRDLAEALLINEKLRRSPPKGWDSTKVIKEWRRKR